MKERRQGHGCRPVPFRPTQRLTRPNKDGIVGGSMTEKNGFFFVNSISKSSRPQSLWPGSTRFLSLPFGPWAAKSGCGHQPAKSVWLPLWQAKRSACPTRGWVKLAPPDRASTGGSSALRTAGGLWGYPAPFRILSPPTHFGFQAALASAVQRPHAAFVVWAENNSIRIVFAAHGGSQAVTGWLGYRRLLTCRDV